jgi:hypothetical protein
MFDGEPTEAAEYSNKMEGSIGMLPCVIIESRLFYRLQATKKRDSFFGVLHSWIKLAVFQDMGGFEFEWFHRS